MKVLSVGFFTLAVGAERYYKLAANLLTSFRKNGNSNAPFAIVCDKENDYTAKFDKVVILPQATCSYMDKIQMLNHLPYDKNVFIDADCLIYNDVSLLLDNCIKGVTCYGWDHPLEEKRKGWFEPENLGILKDRVKFRISTHGGIMFICRDETTAQIYEDCQYISAHYSEFKFDMFVKPADEPVIATAMAANGCKPINRSAHYDVYGFYPTFKECRMNIARKELSYTFDGQKWVNDVKILHWQNHYTRMALYMREMDRLRNGDTFIPILKYPFNLVFQIIRRYIK